VGKGTISISGGTFKGFNPADNEAENPKVDFVAIGYQSVDNGDGTYTVSAKPHGAIQFESYKTYNIASTINASSINYASGNLYNIVINADFTSTSSQYIFDFQNGDVINSIFINGSNKRNADGKVQRGIFLSNITKNVRLDDVYIKDVAYTLNTGSGIDPTKTITVFNAILEGWTSVASFKKATFSRVNFTTGDYFTEFDDPSWNACLRVGTTTLLEGCLFEEGFYISLETLPEGGTLTFKNCKVRFTDIILTAENVAEYLNETEEGTLAKIIFENN
jgi:hypothetical protein